MKPGKQIYAIAYPDEKGVPSYFIHKIIVRPREEAVPHFVKDTKTSIHGLAFDRNKTIWREWRLDTPESIQECVLLDFQHWKISRFTKPPEDIPNIEDVFKKHAKQLKDIYIQTACRSNYPQVTLIDFGSFCVKGQIRDNLVNSSTVDRMFISVNFDQAPMEGRNNSELCRYEFFEAIVRLARAKYIDSGKEIVLSAAVRRIVEEDILKNFPFEPWMEFREYHLWTKDVTDVFMVNLDSIK